MSLLEKNSTGSVSEFQENLDVLRQIYFFSGLPLETLKVFAYLCTRGKFKSGEYLFRQGEDDGQAFYIIEGTAVLERAENGNASAVRTCAAGEFIGGLTLLGKQRRLFSLRADADTSCLILNREKFTKTIEQFPDLMPKIFKAVVSGIGDWEERFLAGRAEKCGDCMAYLGVSLI